MKRNKRGDMIMDTTMLVVFLAIMAVMSIIGYVVYNDLNTDIQANKDLHNETKAVAMQGFSDYSKTMDGGFMTFFVLFWIAILVTAYMLDTHPVYFVIAVFLLAFTIYIGAELSNAFTDVASNPEFAGAAANFPMTYFVMQNLVLFVLLIGMSTALVTYAKFKMGI